MDSIISINKTCENCGSPVSGRRGKRFCSDKCRVDASNQQRARAYNPPFVRNITNALLRNRMMLEKTLDNQATAKASRTTLESMGFNFKYFTNTFRTGDKTYFYCYDYGYMPLKDEWFLIVRLNK